MKGDPINLYNRDPERYRSTRGRVVGDPTRTPKIVNLAYQSCMATSIDPSDRRTKTQHHDAYRVQTERQTPIDHVQSIEPSNVPKKTGKTMTPVHAKGLHQSCDVQQKRTPQDENKHKREGWWVWRLYLLRERRDLRLDLLIKLKNEMQQIQEEHIRRKRGGEGGEISQEFSCWMNTHTTKAENIIYTYIVCW